MIPKRILHDLADVAENYDKSGVHAELEAVRLEGKIQGASGTPYENGVYKIDITITPKYPFEPPKMKFITKIWHPNISSQTGAIGLDVLKDHQWSPALTIQQALLSLQGLMESPEPDDPQDAEVAKQYKTDREGFNRKAKLWNETYASEGKDAAIDYVCAMGFDRQSALKALEDNNWDPQAAANSLLDGI